MCGWGGRKIHCELMRPFSTILLVGADQVGTSGSEKSSEANAEVPLT